MRFETALVGVLPELVKEWYIVHVLADGIKAAESLRAQLPITLQSRYIPKEFLVDGAMEEALVAADLLLGRAGASTLAEAAALGLASIIVPYPYAEGHQRANANALAATGGAVVISDESLTSERLLQEVTALASPEARGRVGRAATAYAKPRAAGDISALLQQLAGEG